MYKPRRRLFNKDERLRIKAVELSIKFMKERSMPDVKAMSTHLEQVYKNIHKFLTNHIITNG